MTSERARPSTPVSPPEKLERRRRGILTNLKRLIDWKTVAVALVLIGVAIKGYDMSLAKRDDLTRVEAAASAANAELAKEAANMRVRLSVVEAGFSELQRSVGKLDDKVDKVYDQLVEIAKATGARQVSPTAPTEGIP